MKKKKKKLVRVRRTWTVNPATKVENEDTGYNRRRHKQDLKKILRETDY